MIQRALDEWMNATVEARPYSVASTVIEAKFLDPENLFRIGMTYKRIDYRGKSLNESSFSKD